MGKTQLQFRNCPKVAQAISLSDCLSNYSTILLRWWLIYFFHYSNFYTLPFYYLCHAISKSVSLSSLALLLPVLVKCYPPPRPPPKKIKRVKNMKNCRIVDYDSSNEGFWCTECNAKNLSSLQSTVHEKIKINRPKWYKMVKMVKNYRFCPIFFRNGTLQRAGIFCVAFTASKRFLWAI